MDPERRRQVERLHHAALERPAEERAKFVARACESDAELRSELESLLAQDLTADSPVYGPAWEGAASLPENANVGRLKTGAQLGPYRIESGIGAGGMGEVYRATDTKLDRQIAIKILPTAFAKDPMHLARFQREARLLAALNHPNIAQIYGLEESGDERALIMELVHGTTLRLPQRLDSALRCARQIAEALEAAHEKGIIHRDLKPSNIIVTPEGVVKILDFGLACTPCPKLTGDGATSPAMSMAVTEAGMVLGTAAYMSPEQATGKLVDKRTDIWSFGVVLYELLSGARLFEGETIGDTLANVLTKPIELAKLPDETPSPIRSLVYRCLDRDPKTQLRDIGEARITLSNPQLEQTPNGRRPKPSRLIGPVLAVAATVLFLVATRSR